MNKRKVINDPVYGFINIPTDLIYDLIEHPWFQRLRRIKQLGLTEFVYPGALHTRFHHAIGAVHLMNNALLHLREKGVAISDEEMEGAFVAILLHDIGHGPFSHTLESTLFEGIHHEFLSLHLMQELNQQFDGKLSLGIQIFENTYHRKCFHQLVSGQLDVDRLDYLQRDCFFTGVSEGSIGADRIIKMLNVVDDQLVVEEKGIYSIENFLNSRRLMYWQVYLHKTSVVAEQMLILLFKRLKSLLAKGEDFNLSPSLKNIANCKIDSTKDITPALINDFVQLDDYDIWAAVKMLQHHPDKVLHTIATQFIQRKLFKLELSSHKPSDEYIQNVERYLQNMYSEDFSFYCSHGKISNEAYVSSKKKIYILTKKNKVIDIAEASELPNIKAISKVVEKHFLCYPKTLEIRG